MSEYPEYVFDWEDGTPWDYDNWWKGQWTKKHACFPGCALTLLFATPPIIGKIQPFRTITVDLEPIMEF